MMILVSEDIKVNALFSNGSDFIFDIHICFIL